MRRVSTLSPGVRGRRVGWQPARAANRRSLVVRTLQACRSWPVGDQWSAASPPPRLPSTSQRPGSARQVHRLTCNRSEVSRIEISCHVTEKAFVGAHTLRCRCARPVRARNLMIHAQNPHPAMRVDPQVAKLWWRAAASKKRRLSRGGSSSKAKEPPQGALMIRHDDAIALGIVKTKINKVVEIG